MKRTIYEQKSHWKRWLLLAASLIVLASLFYTNKIASDIAQQERTKVKLWAKAQKEISSGVLDEQNLSFVFEIIQSNDNIPVVLTDKQDNVLAYLNLDSGRVSRDPNYLKHQIALMKSQNEPILNDLGQGFVNYIYYRDSDLLYELRYYPYILASVVFIFLGIAYFAFSTSRRYEQDFVWVGMAKETAHQLGTPISSLMGWNEYLKMIAPEYAEMNTEIANDVQRLQIIAQRFSKIGSEPELQTLVLQEVMRNAIAYMQIRSPKNVSFEVKMPEIDIETRINEPLFGWVIENLIKNALDAMAGKGVLTIEILEHNKGDRVFIDLSDTGKGIAPKDFERVFKPGFSTKKRGWGLGLTLAKRIIENYHKGKITVKNSEMGKGTTFRIQLPLMD